MIEKHLKCAVCDTLTAIQRKNSRNRPEGHIKHMWCHRCKARRPHIELDEFKVNFEDELDYDSTLLKAYECGIDDNDD